MRKVFQLDGGVYHFLTTIYHLMLINFLVILFSLPIFTIGSAVSAATHLYIDLNEGKGSPIFSLYWRYFKQHFKQSTFFYIGSLVLFLLISWLIYLTLQTPVQFLSMLLLAFMGIVFMNLLTTVAYRSQTIQKVWVLALGISIKYTGYFCLSISCFVGSLLIPIFLPKLMFLWFFFGVSVPLSLQTKIYLYCMEQFKKKYLKEENVEHTIL